MISIMFYITILSGYRLPCFDKRSLFPVIRRFNINLYYKIEVKCFLRRNDHAETPTPKRPVLVHVGV